MNDVLEKLQRVKIQNKTRLSKEDQQFCQIQQKLYDSTRNHFLSMFVDMETLAPAGTDLLWKGTEICRQGVPTEPDLYG